MVLIPKLKALYSPTDFRLICLCNPIHKIISKIISNRLTTILPNIIVENQGAFLKKRRVGPMAHVELKLIHNVVNATKSTNHMINIVVKLDLSKVFDKVEWSYLITILQKYCFPPFSFIGFNNVSQLLKLLSYTTRSEPNTFPPLMVLNKEILFPLFYLFYAFRVSLLC